MVDDNNEWKIETPQASGIFGAVFNQVTGFFVAGFESVWSGFLKLVPQAVNDGVEAFRSYYDNIEDAVWSGVFRMLADMSIVDKETIANLLKFKGLPFPVNSMVNIIVLALTLGEYVKTVAHATGTPARHNLMKMFSPELPFSSEVIRAAFIAPERTAEVREILKKSGFADDAIDLMFLAQYGVYDAETIRVLWLRNILSDDEMFMRMRELGFTDTRIKEIVQTWELIPGPQDILTMVAKEAFEPDAVELMGLDDEFPAAQGEWLSKQGLNDFWQHQYWRAHWEQPSIQMGFEMFHRGIINEKDLDMLFRTVEIPPYWRQKLIDIAYNVYTRVDVRRMHDMGVLNDVELIQAYKDAGYNQERAEKMAEFTKRYNAQSKKDLTLSQITQGYKELIIPRSDAIDYLMSLDYKQEDAEYLLDLEDYKALKELSDALIKNIQVRFEGNLITSQEARSKLNSLNLPAVQVEALLEKWTVNRFEDMKLPSKTDLDKMLKSKIIDDATYYDQMYRLGYEKKYIDWYYKLIKK